MGLYNLQTTEFCFLFPFSGVVPLSFNETASDDSAPGMSRLCNKEEEKHHVHQWWMDIWKVSPTHSPFNWRFVVVFYIASVKIELLLTSSHKRSPFLKGVTLLKAGSRLCSVAECPLSPGGCHAVSILYPWASPQQWPTWESRPGGGINQLPPSPSGLLRLQHAAAPGSEPSEALSPWEPAGFPRDENCVSEKPTVRRYFA